MLLCMLLMYTTAHHRIRQQAYETFWYTHHLFIPFMLALYTHATGCFVRDTAEPFSPFAGQGFWDHCLGYEGWRWELAGAALYLCERLYREIRSRRETVITKVIRHPYGMSQESMVSMNLANPWNSCDGDSILQAKHEIQGRPMAIPSGPRCIKYPVQNGRF